MYIGDIVNIRGLTTNKINAILNPEIGSLVNNITINKFQRFDGTTWVDIGLNTNVLFYNSIINFPIIGVTDKIYVAKDTLIEYFWKNNNYEKIKSQTTWETDNW